MSAAVAAFIIAIDSLNPCCNGIYSMRQEDGSYVEGESKVLILVVMEYTQ